MQNVVCKMYVTGQRKLELISSPFSWMVSSRKLCSFHAASIVHVLYWVHCTEPDHTPGHRNTVAHGVVIRILQVSSMMKFICLNFTIACCKEFSTYSLKVQSWIHFTFHPFVMSFSSSSLLFPKVWLFLWNKQEDPIQVPWKTTRWKWEQREQRGKSTGRFRIRWEEF